MKCSMTLSAVAAASVGCELLALSPFYQYRFVALRGFYLLIKPTREIVDILYETVDFWYRFTEVRSQVSLLRKNPIALTALWKHCRRDLVQQSKENHPL